VLVDVQPNDSDSYVSSGLEPQASCLLEGIEAVLEEFVTPNLKNQHRLLNFDPVTGLSRAISNTSSELWGRWSESGKASLPSVKTHETAIALAEIRHGLDASSFQEIYLRTSSHWVIGRANERSLAETFIVLPPSVGKEGSLIDADREMRKTLNLYSI